MSRLPSKEECELVPVLDGPVNIGRRLIKPPNPWKLARVEAGLGARVDSGGPTSAREVRRWRGGSFSGLAER